MADRAPTAAELADGLRRLATLIEQLPDGVPDAFRYGLGNITAPMASVDDEKSTLATVARAAVAAGATVKKKFRGEYFDLIVKLGPVQVVLIASRDEVCERVVVGTREVTEEVPDPEALRAVPKVTRTTVVEDVEWRCGPLLGGSDG